MEPDEIDILLILAMFILILTSFNKESGKPYSFISYTIKHFLMFVDIVISLEIDLANNL